VATEAARGLQVVAAAGVNQDHNQEGHNADGDPRYFYPAWCAGVGRRVSHVRLFFS
jgi:hypothetical protein